MPNDIILGVLKLIVVMLNANMFNVTGLNVIIILDDFILNGKMPLRVITLILIKWSLHSERQYV
jgi:hypothetical protein